MNNSCLKNKVLPDEEKGYCDCCFSEDIKVIICPSNNKCEYAMCEKCINNLEKKTKTNKCPACREEIITIKNIILDEPENTEDNIRMTWTLNICLCCICVYEFRRTNYPRTKAWLSCLQHSTCCIYNYFRTMNDKRKSIAFSTLMHILLIFIGRITYAIWYNENTTGEFWSIWWVFLGKSIIGLSILILILFIIVIALSCLWNCCCVEGNDDW